jgi:hypothetical protein
MLSATNKIYFGESFNTTVKNRVNGEQDYSKKSPVSHSEMTTEDANHSREERKIVKPSFEKDKAKEEKKKSLNYNIR